MAIPALAALVGATGLLVAERDLNVPVRIKDVKTAWSRVDYLVTPIGGSGEKWVDSARVRITTGMGGA